MAYIRHYKIQSLATSPIIIFPTIFFHAQSSPATGFLSLEIFKPTAALDPLHLPGTLFPQIFTCLTSSLHTGLWSNVTLSERSSVVTLYQVACPSHSLGECPQSPCYALSFLHRTCYHLISYYVVDLFSLSFFPIKIQDS